MKKTYTKYNDCVIDQTISWQIDEIATKIVAEVKDVVALFLIGGYARGEGSVLLTNDGLIPLGDYDFLAITRFPHRSVDFPWLESLQKKFRIQYHIGVSIIWLPVLPFLGKRIYWYETKFGSRLVYGNEKPLELIRINDGTDISLNEGFSLMFNRLMGLLKVFDFSVLEAQPSEVQRQHLIFQSVKLILACGESLLLSVHRYHFSYEERCRRLMKDFENKFGELLSVDPDLPKDYERAAHFKLEPRFEMYKDAVKLSFSAKKHVLFTLAFYMKQKTLGLNSSAEAFETYLDPDFFVRLLLQNSRPDLSNRILDFVEFSWNSIKATKSLRGIRFIKPLFSDYVRASMFYLALSLQDEGNIDKTSLGKAIKTISTIIPVGKHMNEEKNLRKKWRLTRDLVLSTWNLARQ